MLQTLPVADHTYLEGDHASMLSVSFLSPTHLRPDGDASLLVGGAKHLWWHAYHSSRVVLM